MHTYPTAYCASSLPLTAIGIYNSKRKSEVEGGREGGREGGIEIAGVPDASRS